MTKIHCLLALLVIASVANGFHLNFVRGLKPNVLRNDVKMQATVETLPQYVLEVDNAKAYVRTYGANAFSYVTKDNIEVMGTRKDAVDVTSDSKPYAGGAPHCFPQFGPGAILQHGFARGMKFISEGQTKEASFDRVSLKLVPTEDTLKIWNHNFEYRVIITLRAEYLEWDLTVVNHGSEPFDITLGLHNYFDISSLKNVVISGAFAGSETLDKVTGEVGRQDSNEVTITVPIDKLYKGVSGPVTITDTGKGTKTVIESKGFPDFVLWNPYGNEAMGFDKFICAEPVRAAPQTIAVGKEKEVHYYQKVSLTKI